MSLKTYHWIDRARRPTIESVATADQETEQVSAHKEPASPSAPASPTTRRAALAAALAMPLAAEPAAGSDATAALIERAAEKNAAFMRGDMPRWAELVRIARDFTLMQPFGGPASHGFDKSPQRLAEMSRYFRNGKTQLEVAQTYASSELVVLVMIERQTGEVGGLPEQDWSLRVTEVYRKAGSEWDLVQRHPDAGVHRITLEQLSALARGVIRG
jgi:ketosteroid isomerase-like protein